MAERRWPIWRCPACGQVVHGPYVVKALKKCSTKPGDIEVHIVKAVREDVDEHSYRSAQAE